MHPGVAFSRRPGSVQSGLNDPADLVVVVGFVRAVEPGPDPPVEHRPPPGRASASAGDRGAQRPGDVEPGPLGGRRRLAGRGRRARRPGPAGRRAGRARPARASAVVEPARRERVVDVGPQRLDAAPVRGRAPGRRARRRRRPAPAGRRPSALDSLDPVDEVERVALDAGLRRRARRGSAGPWCRAAGRSCRRTTRSTSVPSRVSVAVTGSAPAGSRCASRSSRAASAGDSTTSSVPTMLGRGRRGVDRGPGAIAGALAQVARARRASVARSHGSVRRVDPVDRLLEHRERAGSVAGGGQHRRLRRAGAARRSAGTVEVARPVPSRSSAGRRGRARRRRAPARRRRARSSSSTARSRSSRSDAAGPRRAVGQRELVVAAGEVQASRRQQRLHRTGPCRAAAPRPRPADPAGCADRRARCRGASSGIGITASKSARAREQTRLGLAPPAELDQQRGLRRCRSGSTGTSGHPAPGPISPWRREQVGPRARPARSRPA